MQINVIITDTHFRKAFFKKETVLLHSYIIGDLLLGHYYRGTRLSTCTTWLVTRSICWPLAVLVYPLLVLVCPSVVFVCPFACPFVVLVYSLVISVCTLVSTRSTICRYFYNWSWFVLICINVCLCYSMFSQSFSAIYFLDLQSHDLVSHSHTCKRLAPNLKQDLVLKLWLTWQNTTKT